MRVGVSLLLAVCLLQVPTLPGVHRVVADTTVRVLLPFAARGPGAPPPAIDETYDAITIEGDPETRPAAGHPDLNLAVRGYEAAGEFRGLVDYGGATDPDAPQLGGLLGRAPVVVATYRVYDWDWQRMARGALIMSPPVTLITLAAGQNAIVRVPGSGRLISEQGHQVLVLYADEDRITLKYTREDNVIQGYTLHLEGVRVAPALLALYRSANDAGRRQLPALRAGQALGWSAGDALGVAVRDMGAFLDPRSRKDWWRGF